MDLNSLVKSLIRTCVPIVAGAAIAWAARQGIDAGSLQGPLTEILTAVFAGAYYLAVRALESRWPRLGWLLGHPDKPVYPSATKMVRVQSKPKG